MGDFKFLSKFLCLFALYAVVNAGYNYLDDGNPTIQYTSTAVTQQWHELNSTSGSYLTGGNGSTIILDYSRMYDQTA
jgi:hypothetical protein